MSPRGTHAEGRERNAPADRLFEFADRLDRLADAYVTEMDTGTHTKLTYTAARLRLLGRVLGADDLTGPLRNEIRDAADLVAQVIELVLPIGGPR